jgi:hypothetical protein
VWLSYSELLVIPAIAGTFLVVTFELIDWHYRPSGKYGMALPLTSMIRKLRIFQALIVPNPAVYLRNLLEEVIAPSHQIA